MGWPEELKELIMLVLTQEQDSEIVIVHVDKPDEEIVLRTGSTERRIGIIANDCYSIFRRKIRPRR